jgi:hypothetical protein
MQPPEVYSFGEDEAATSTSGASIAARSSIRGGSYSVVVVVRAMIRPVTS